MPYKIGSFNCLNFGLGANKDLKVFCDIIAQEQFDIIALQEIKGPLALLRILKVLNVSADKWDGRAETYNNDFAFIWNKTKFRLAENEKHKPFEPRVWHQYKTEVFSGESTFQKRIGLRNDPYYARFEPLNGPFFEIRVITTHIRFTKGKDDEDVSAGAVILRKNEFKILCDSILAKIEDKRYGNNRQAFTFLMGDYNLNHPNSTVSQAQLESVITVFDNQNVKEIKTFQTDLSTLKKHSDESDTDKSPYASNYDHFTYDDTYFSNRNINCTCYRVEAVEKYCKGDFEKYEKEVSDHLPIAIELNF